MTYESRVKLGSSVSFPSFQNERIYMLPFLQKQGLPPELARWQETVNQMLTGISTNLPIYLMIDQSFVEAGKPQRRPGLHIDGYWVENEGHNQHRGKSAFMGLHKPTPPSPGGHRAQSSLSHHGTHRGTSHFNGRHSTHRGNRTQDLPWDKASFKEAETIILASNISAARAFTGTYQGLIKDMGDCSEINPTGMTEVRFEANRAYLGNVNFLHESLPVAQDSFRTLVRLNVPGIDF